MQHQIFTKRGRKGDLSINMIIVAIIAIVVLVVILFIWNNQTKKVTGGYTDITNKALNSKCEGFLGEGGTCKLSCAATEDPVKFPEGSSSKEWADCKERSLTACCKPKPEEKKL